MKQDWEGVLCKVEGKFSALGARWLNLVGHIVLIKSILTTLPLCKCSALLAPQSVVNHLTKEIRNFL